MHIEGLDPAISQSFLLVSTNCSRRFMTQKNPVLFATPVLIVASGFWILDDACICPVFGSTTGHHGQMTAEGLMQLVSSA